MIILCRLPQYLVLSSRSALAEFSCRETNALRSDLTLTGWRQRTGGQNTVASIRDVVVALAIIAAWWLGGSSAGMQSLERISEDADSGPAKNIHPTDTRCPPRLVIASCTSKCTRYMYLLHNCPCRPKTTSRGQPGASQVILNLASRCWLPRVLLHAAADWTRIRKGDATRGEKLRTMQPLKRVADLKIITAAFTGETGAR